MEAVNLSKYLRISPKKIKGLASLIVDLSPDRAQERLSFIGGKAPKLLSSAIAAAKANAVNNLKLNAENLLIKEVVVGKGPFFKRWNPVSRGSAHQIKKRTTHLKVTVAENEKSHQPLVQKTQQIEKMQKEKK